MTPPRSTPKVSSTVNRFIKLLLSLSVSVGVGLAPYLGKVKVPGFTTLLSLFPESIAGVSIAFSSATMGIVAAYVQFYDRSPVETIDRKFRYAVRCCIVLLGLLLVLYFVTVTRVHYDGGVHSASFVTGFTGSTDARCAQKSSAQCILDVAQSREDAIDILFGEPQIRLANGLLVIVYVGFMSAFAYLAALIILKSGKGAPSRGNAPPLVPA